MPVTATVSLAPACNTVKPQSHSTGEPLNCLPASGSTCKRGSAELNEATCETCAVDWPSHLSTEGASRQPASLSKLMWSAQSAPGAELIPFHAGLPPPSAFPLAAITLTLQDGSTVNICDPDKLAAAQQYNTSGKGYVPLYSWAHAHMRSMHAPPGDHDCIVTPGANQTIELVFGLLLNRGDSFMCEEFIYPHVAESISGPKGYRPLPLPSDEHGLTPQGIVETLHNLQLAGQPLPRMLYTIPVGQNPTGVVTPEERKRAIYEVCRAWDIVIVEDDAYYFLQFPGPDGELKGLSKLGASYLSMDTDGRVVRIDSFAKFVAPGFRLGWATAHPFFLNKLCIALGGTNLGPCSTTQVMVAELLAAWGPSGLEAHVCRAQAEYARRAEVAHAAAQEHLQGLAEWARPAAGMFLWLRLLAGVADADQVLPALQSQGVVVVPGRCMHCHSPNPGKPIPFIRVSFALATDAQLRRGFERLGAVLREFESQQQQSQAGMCCEAGGCC